MEIGKEKTGCVCSKCFIAEGNYAIIDGDLIKFNLQDENKFNSIISDNPNVYEYLGCGFEYYCNGHKQEGYVTGHIWKRKKEKKVELTMGELEKILGMEVKIVNN